MLNAEIGAYKANPWPVGTDMEEKPSGQVRGNIRDLDPHISLVFADVIHNLRAALEYAVYSPGKPASGFPIYRIGRSSRKGPGRPRTYAKDGVKDIQRLPPKAQEFIESIQPYHRHRRDLGLLGPLQTLWTAEKHRTVPVLASSGVYLYGQDFPAGYDHLAEDADFSPPDLDEASIAAGWWKPLQIDDNLKPHPTIGVYVWVGRDRWDAGALATALYGYVGWIIVRLHRLLKASEPGRRRS